MKEILVFSKEIYPFDNASTNCLYRIIDAFLEKGCKTTVISECYDSRLPDEEYYNNCFIRRVKIPEQAYADRLFGSKISSTPFRYVLILISFLASKYVSAARKIRMRRAYRELCGTHEFDCIMSMSQPAINHKNACAVITKKDKWILLNLDPYVFSYESPRFAKLHIKRWVKKASGVINLIGINEENERRNYFPYKNIPNISIPLPNLFVAEQQKKKEHEKKQLLYTGAFYEEIRNPGELLKILGKLDPEKYSAEFYGSCCAYLKSRHSRLPECVHLMGCVDTKRCRQLTEEADVLINVGNTVANQIPSKVFEYIGSGKPILNIYSDENDLALPYLMKYPQIFNIRTGEETDADKLTDFLEKAENVPPDTIRTIYSDSLAEKVLKQITDFIERC